MGVGSSGRVRGRPDVKDNNKISQSPAPLPVGRNHTRHKTTHCLPVAQQCSKLPLIRGSSALTPTRWTSCAPPLPWPAPSEPALEHVSAASLHLAPLGGLDVLQEVVLHTKGKTKVVPAGGHTEDNVIKQLQQGGLGVEEGVCGREGHTLTSGGPYSTQHSLGDTQDSKSQPIFTSSRRHSTQLTFTDGWTPLCSNCSSTHNWSRTGDTHSYIPHRSKGVSGWVVQWREV